MVASKGGFQPLVAGLGEEEIVVDDVSEESKMKTAAEMLAGSSSGPLKLKLSCKPSLVNSSLINREMSEISDSKCPNFPFIDLLYLRTLLFHLLKVVTCFLNIKKI